MSIMVAVFRLMFKLAGHRWYYSTSCLHGEHRQCRADHGCAGEPKRPFTCKWCVNRCICGCHTRD